MTKRPKELRVHNHDENNYAIPTINIKCRICDSSEDVKNVDGVQLCENCSDCYCDICNRVKPFITVKRDENNTNDHKQCCSDCYLSLCKSIINADEEYCEKSIDVRKSEKYNQ